MPTAYEKLRDRLSRRPLPTSLLIRDVIRVMEEQGYTLKVTGSHHIFRKPDADPVNFSVHNKRLKQKAVRDLAALFEEWER